MKAISCKDCKTDIKVIDLRVALDASVAYSHGCGRTLGVDQMQEVLDRIDMRRLRDKFRNKLARDRKGMCPCCHQHAEIYNRHLNRTKAEFCEALYKLGGGRDRKPVTASDAQGWIAKKHSASGRAIGSTARGGDYGKARHWDLIENETKPDGTVVRGSWRLTEKGCDWVEGKINLPKSVHVYNDRAGRFFGEERDFVTALNDSDYPRRRAAVRA